MILTWNRREEILRTLDELAALPAAGPRQVIVVDNGSTDGTAGAIDAQFPGVDVVRLEQNVGTSGWNAGFARAQAPYVLSLDDDSHPLGDWLDKVAAAFERLPQAGMIACRVLRGTEAEDVTAGWPSRVTSFIACGALFRREVFASAGMYDARIFLYAHEKEMAVRVLAAGWDICYEPGFVVCHRAASAHRSSRRFLQLGVQDSVYRLARYYPVWQIPLAMLMTLDFHRRWCRRRADRISRYSGTVIGALARGVVKGMRHRQPLPLEVRRRIAETWRGELAKRNPRAASLAARIPGAFFW